MRLLHPWDSPGKNTGVGCHFLLQETFPNQGLNPGLPHGRQTLYHLNPGGASGKKKEKKKKNPPANVGDERDSGSTPGWEDPLEEGMATYSSILAWRIPRTEEPGGVGHD